MKADESIRGNQLSAASDNIMMRLLRARVPGCIALCLESSSQLVHERESGRCEATLNLGLHDRPKPASSKIGTALTALR